MKMKRKGMKMMDRGHEVMMDDDSANVGRVTVVSGNNQTIQTSTEQSIYATTITRKRSNNTTDDNHTRT
ncbi:hypothetical protein LR48_Vigan2369s000100 [Vigna angularis]|nr:hypothetical protein LR48_Vigan2369s000100 [Vigna angularis]